MTAFTVVLPETQYPTLAAQRRFLVDVLERVRALPGVRSAGASFGLPLTDTRFSLTFTVAGRPEPSPPDEPSGQVRVATPEYFRTMGIPLIRGRTFTDQDSYESRQVMVISQELARRYFRNEDPLGRHISAGWHREGRVLSGVIVGIVGDVKQFGLRQDSPPAYYAAADQWPSDEITVVVQESSSSPAHIPALRAAVREIDRNLPVFDVRDANTLVAEALSEPRFYLLLLGSFAGIAVVLGAVGIYGVIAYTVRQRTREIGVRMALGATSGRILRMVVGEGMALTALGIAFGIAGALLTTGELRTLLFETAPEDKSTLGGVSLLLTVVAVIACLLPARGAARVSPHRALRGDS